MKLFELQSFDLAKFEQDCQPWLNAMAGSTEPAWHGSKETFDWEIRQMRVRPKPRNTPVDLHNSVNDYFESRFNGWRAREQGMFITGHANTAYGYGKLFTIFPIGNFKSLWSPEIEDLTSTYSDFKSMNKKDTIWDDNAAAKDLTLDYVQKCKWYLDEKVKEGLMDGNEIIVNCEAFYIFNKDLTYQKTIRPFLIKKGYLTQ